MNTAQEIAAGLLKIEAIKLSPHQPFTWASGWHSPIYCDNRKTLAYPALRNLIAEHFVQRIKTQYPAVEVIAGVATGAIAHGLLVADRMNLPFVYVRPQPKAHGLGNQIEGELQFGKKVVVVEDLISTGGSSLSALAALRVAGAEVQGMVAIFTYAFPLAEENFKKAQCDLHTLLDYSTLIEEARKMNYVSSSDIALLEKWRLAPEKFRVQI